MGRYKSGFKVFRFTPATVAWITAVLAFLMIGSISAYASDIILLDVEGAITPPVASYIVENIDYGIEKGASAVIIRMDTPGGLDTAMRKIIKKEMNAHIPVIVYVAPQGARAASAGAIITLASDIAAMAPGTNIGAAHPVNIGAKSDKEDTTMTEKVTNDAVAYVRSIAHKRGRSEEWAEDIVRKSISTPSEEALKKGVIDIIANNTDDLIASLDGRKIKKNDVTFELKTKNANIIERPMGFRYRLLSTISNPNIAYILMMIGLAGLYFELANPGAILPGVVGGISLILAFFAFQALPVNYAGVALILLAIVLFIAEIKVPSFGLLTVGGVISLVLGSIILFRTPELYAKVSWGVLLPVTALFTAFFAISVFLVVKVHRKSPITGIDGLLGERAIVYKWKSNGTGKVFCHGEYWEATGPPDIKKGAKVKITDVDHLELKIKPAEDKN
ncbi:MAG: nodulation protein NfeD [Thermodesulfobacteriota bacterium]|nr:nodulation protein NfeD [Thermodesulfobacteriota bacterium]